ncbi:hypothetical protein LguiB_026929 [Lonicera macranthoides]
MAPTQDSFRYIQLGVTKLARGSTSRPAIQSLSLENFSYVSRSSKVDVNESEMVISLFFSFIWLPQILTPSNAAAGIANATNTAKPGCQRQCGNVVIPYPFGIGLGSHCSIPNSPNFEINCDTSFNPPKPYIGHELSLSNGPTHERRLDCQKSS